MKIKLPFCYLENTLYQEVDLDKTHRSRFQIETLKQISERDNFAYFVTMLAGGKQWVVADDEPGCKCPFLICWYDRQGCMHTMYIGQKRIIDPEWISEPMDIVPLDHVVYTSRTGTAI